MFEYFESLEPLLQGLWYLAIPTTVLFTLQTILSFIGGDSDIEMDEAGGEIDSNHFPIFSLRNLLNFLLGFSYTGISLYDSIRNRYLLIFISVIIGILFLLLFVFVIKIILKLSEDNTFKITDTLNQSAKVYLTIPSKKQGKGKILISVKGSVHELDCMTENEELKTGTLVKIIKIESDNILIVKSI